MMTNPGSLQQGPLWLAMTIAGCIAIVRGDIAQRRVTFRADTQIAHRILGQRAAQHDAVLAMLSLTSSEASSVEQHLRTTYPQIVAVQHRDANSNWNDPMLATAE